MTKFATLGAAIAFVAAIATAGGLTGCGGGGGGGDGDGGGGGGGPVGGTLPPAQPLPTPPALAVGEGEPLPGCNLVITDVVGATGANGAVQAGDVLGVRFTAKTDDGTDLHVPTMTNGQIYLSGPTSNYNRVIVPQTNVVAGAFYLGGGEWGYYLPAMPSVYAAPINDTASFGADDGELTGQALLSGTYTIGLQLVANYEVGGVNFRDAGSDTFDLRYGAATSLEPRGVVSDANCNACHTEVRAHGGSRVHVDLCLLCHTAGSEDRNVPTAAGGTPGVSVDFKVMIHKIHAGRSLPSVLGIATDVNGARTYSNPVKPLAYVGYQDSVVDLSHVVFPVWPSFASGMPRDVGWGSLSTTDPDGSGPLLSPQSSESRSLQAPVSCAKCHGDPDGAGPLPAPAQAALVTTLPTRKACGSCHDDVDWTKPYTANLQSMGADKGNETCALSGCHTASGTPISVEDAHRHPMVDPAYGAGVNFVVTSVTDVGGNGNGRFDAGEKIGFTFRVENNAGAPVNASLLSRIEVVISGPTTNPQVLNYKRVAPAYFTGAGPYTVNMPENVYYEPAGTSTAALETFTTLQAPHWNVSGAATTLRLRTGTGAGTTLAAATKVTQNYLDVAPGAGALFAKDNYVVVDDASPGAREYMLVQWVQGDRLWFGSRFRDGTYKPNLLKPHAAGATVDIATTVAVPTASWTIVAATGVITEVVEFGAGEVLASYVSDFVVPSVYPGALDDSPVNGTDWADWTGLSVLDGTYTFDIHGGRSVTYTQNATSTSYTDGAPPTIVHMLFGAATEVVLPARIAGPATCYACHDDIAFHGSSRRGVEACLSCHGSSGAENTLLYENPASGNPFGTTVEFRSFLHHAHKDVFPSFVGGVANCVTCHGAGNTAWADVTPRSHPAETLKSRGWMVGCLGCHDSTAAQAHADTNTAPDGTEACTVCHGEGKPLDVVKVHVPR